MLDDEDLITANVYADIVAMVDTMFTALDTYRTTKKETDLYKVHHIERTIRKMMREEEIRQQKTKQ